MTALNRSGWAKSKLTRAGAWVKMRKFPSTFHALIGFNLFLVFRTLGTFVSGADVYQNVFIERISTVEFPSTMVALVPPLVLMTHSVVIWSQILNHKLSKDMSLNLDGQFCNANFDHLQTPELYCKLSR